MKIPGSVLSKRRSVICMTVGGLTTVDANTTHIKEVQSNCFIDVNITWDQN